MAITVLPCISVLRLDWIAASTSESSALVAIQIKQLARVDHANTVVFYTYVFWVPMSLLPALFVAAHAAGGLADCLFRDFLDAVDKAEPMSASERATFMPRPPPHCGRRVVVIERGRFRLHGSRRGCRRCTLTALRSFSLQRYLQYERRSE